MPKKAAIKKIITVILLIMLAAGISLYKEHKLRRAFLGTEGLTFDGMLFERCTDYKLTSTFEKSKIICKTTNGDWIIWSVDGYKENYEYVYARCFMDGYYYERIN